MPPRHVAQVFAAWFLNHMTRIRWRAIHTLRHAENVINVQMEMTMAGGAIDPAYGKVDAAINIHLCVQLTPNRTHCKQLADRLESVLC